MQVLLLMIMDRHRGKWLGPSFGWVVMPWPDLHVVAQGEKSASGVEEVGCVTAGEVAARGADICMEDGVAAKNVLC